MSEPKKIILIDGHSLAYRAFYALPPDLVTSSGQMINAVYGFTSMLIKVLEELRPGAVIVAFDKGKAEFRTERFADYKAHRKPMPDGLREQLDMIHAVLGSLGMPVFEQEGYEADDILATLTEKIPEDSEIYIVTSDRDALQLVTDKVKVVANRKGITDIMFYDPEKVKERYGVEPAQIVDYLALKGDSSDNIPGVPGIGEKTAAALIGEYGTLDEVYANLEKVKGAKCRTALEENRDNAYMSRELATMRRDVPIEDGKLGDWELRPWDEREVEKLFASLEFRKLYDRLSNVKPSLFTAGENIQTEVKPFEPLAECIVEDEASLEELRADYRTRGELSIYPHIAGEGFTSGEMVSLSTAVGDKCYYMKADNEDGQKIIEDFISGLAEERTIRINCYRGKDCLVQWAKFATGRPSIDFDVELASYLVNPSGVKHELAALASRYLRVDLEKAESGQLGLLEEEFDESGRDMQKALAVDRIVQPLEAEMNLMDLRCLFEQVEMPLELVLADMEIRGVRLDIELLYSMQRELEDELGGLEKRIFETAGEEFNLNSPQQLAHVLFDVLELPPSKKTKTGYATDISVLTSLRDQHPIADQLLRYRELSKLLNTYLVALPKMVDPTTGRLHASFNQTVTSTGRLSSSNPNLQNIPIRTAMGKMIRKAFLPTSPDGLIICADYSQIELRIMAHLSGDEGLKQAFEDDLDIHAATASEVFGIPLSGINAEYRRRAKAINFGIIYGISPFGLSQQLDIEQAEAEAYIRNYFQKYPGVRSFLDGQVRECSRTGCVCTILGRRREIPELAEGNIRMRRLGERLAFNTPIQGSAADIIKLAMLHIHERMGECKLKSQMILQVHDELVFDAESEEADILVKIVREEMENAFPLDVPLKVDVAMGPTWYDAK
ncbi:MAG: DNA polymerase I [Candidatus Solincola sediminis]|nr:MAG: DNA polymerase I [Candidatus Solincola sediminis]